MPYLVIIGSRNPQGQTAHAVNALIDGMKENENSVEVIFLPVQKIERCRQCDDDGWGLCRREGKCVIDDDFAGIVDKIRESKGVVFATPVYFGDLSESLKAFTDRLRRTCMHQGMRATLDGKRCIGVCVAGGGGGGSPSCCFNLEKVLGRIGFDVVDVIPVRRQTLLSKQEQLRSAGEQFVS